jgi:hypothetical protein
MKLKTKNFKLALKPIFWVFAVIGRSLCNHNFIKTGIDHEHIYSKHHYGMVANHKCSKCGKESVRTTSNVYIRLS